MITKADVKLIKEELKGTFATKDDLKKFATKRELNKMKKEIIGAIANVSVNSPTSNQFNELEERVTRLEAAVN